MQANSTWLLNQASMSNFHSIQLETRNSYIFSTQSKVDVIEQIKYFLDATIKKLQEHDGG